MNACHTINTGSVIYTRAHIQIYAYKTNIITQREENKTIQIQSEKKNISITYDQHYRHPRTKMCVYITVKIEIIIIIIVESHRELTLRLL